MFYMMKSVIFHIVENNLGASSLDKSQILTPPSLVANEFFLPLSPILTFIEQVHLAKEDRQDHQSG